jgi:hypothetical protein
MEPKDHEKKYRSKIPPKIPKTDHAVEVSEGMCQYQYNQTLKKVSPKNKPKCHRYLVATKKTKSTNKTQKSDCLTVEDVKVYKWMKKQVPGSKESGSGIIRVAFCSMCAVLCAWVIASSKVVRRPWTGIWYTSLSSTAL